MLCLLFTAPGLVRAEGMNNREFLQLSDTAKKFWIQGSIETMAATLNGKDKALALCVVNWYYGDKYALRNGLILGSMKKYPDAIPTAVMVALVERACGKFWNKSQS